MKRLFILLLVLCFLFQTAFVQNAQARLTGTWSYVATGVFIILLYIGILAIEGELAPEPKEQHDPLAHAEALYAEEMRFREEAAAQQDAVVRNFYSKSQSESSKSHGQKDDFVLTLPLGRELLRQARQLCCIHGAPNFTELAAGMLKYEAIPACKNYIQLYGEESLDECIKECAYQVVGEFYLSCGGPGDRIAREAESLKELVTGFFQMAKEEALKKIFVRVKVKSANIRDGPSVENKVIAQAKYNTSLLAIEESGKWYKVKSADGLVGWIYAPLCLKESQK